MTINELQLLLIDEIIQIVGDIDLTDKNGKRAELSGYQQAIPVFPVFSEDPSLYDRYQGDNLFPYFVVRADNVSYGGSAGNVASIMIMFAIYDEDPTQKGYYTLTAIMERIIMRFRTDPVLGPFYCSDQMTIQYQEDDSYPQFFGGIEMAWYLPDTER